MSEKLTVYRTVQFMCAKISYNMIFHT